MMHNAMSLKTDGQKIIFNNLNAITKNIGQDEIAIQFEGNMPTKIISVDQASALYGNTILFRSDKLDSAVYPTQLDIGEQVIQDKINLYLKELNLQAGLGGYGGDKLRKSVIEKVAKEQGDNCPPSITTLYRWQLLANNQAQGIQQWLLSQRTPKKREGKFVKSGVYDIALRCIDDEYLTTKQTSITLVYTKFIESVRNELGSVDVPSRTTFSTWIADITPIQKVIKRQGKRKAKQQNRNATKELLTERALQRVEADGLHLSIGIVDDNGNYLGRTIILIVFDVHTRCVLGFKVIVAKAENSSAIIDSYRHALLPKTVGALCKNEYPMCGVFESVFTDGGRGYLAKNSVAFLALAGIQQDTVQSYSGWKKPFVERFNGTIRTKFAKKLDSYCGRMDDDRSAELTIQQKATLTLPEFEALFEKWVVDEYHQTVHSKLNCTPHEAWTNFFKGTSPMLPVNYKHIQKPAGETKLATISGDACHLGVKINTLRYNDADGELKKIGMQLKAERQPSKVECHYSETNIFEIMVINPFTGEDFIVETTSRDATPGMSLIEYKMLIKARKDASNGTVADSGLDELISQANGKTAIKTKGKTSKKQFIAKPDDLEKEILKQSELQKNELEARDLSARVATRNENDHANDLEEFGEDTYDKI